VILLHVYLNDFEAGHFKALFSNNNSELAGYSIACIGWAFLLLSFPTGERMLEPSSPSEATGYSVEESK
jgi:hypothetical protein